MHHQQQHLRDLASAAATAAADCDTYVPSSSSSSYHPAAAAVTEAEINAADVDNNDWHRRLGNGDGNSNSVYCSIAGSNVSASAADQGWSDRQEVLATAAAAASIETGNNRCYRSQLTQTEDAGGAGNRNMHKGSPGNTSSATKDDNPKLLPTLAGIANKLIGVLVMLYIAYQWSWYLLTLHDNEFWFSNIKEVEREISFRTEQGLYYSYYKQLVNSESLYQGMQDLQRDNLTEHQRTINIFQRFNIHQELFLAAAYRFGQNFRLRPVFFYTQSVFALQGFMLAVLFILAWNLGRTWLAGVLTTAFVVCHRLEITRVEFTIPLREHFSLPFIFAQFLVAGLYFEAKTNKHEKLFLATLFGLTFLLTITWQFAQFVLLLQTMVLLALALINILNSDKVCKMLSSVFLSIVLVWSAQFYQPMVLNSLVCSLIPVAVVLLQMQSGAGVGGDSRVARDRRKARGAWRQLAVAAGRFVAAVLVAVALNTIIKLLCGQDSDNHIFRFVRSKFGYDDQTDFETRLYLCLTAFQSLNWDYYMNLSKSGAFPLYVFAVCFETFRILLTVFRGWGRKEKDGEEEEEEETASGTRAVEDSGRVRRRKGSQKEEEDEKPREEESEKKPSLYAYLDAHDLAFLTGMRQRPALCLHIAQSLILGVLAMTTLRMKCFWGPYICVLASSAVCHVDLWRYFIGKLVNLDADGQGGQKAGGQKGQSLVIDLMRNGVLVFIVFALFSTFKDGVYKELENLREFYDPDTVQLMEWIKSSTPKTAAFTGSMQLLAGVKLCTGRPLTNHPHFEDKELRARTRELYQIYAKVPASEVHSILAGYNASYIILEDSICLSSPEGRCNLPSTMDLSNGHIPDDGLRDPPSLEPSPHPRFCLEARHERPPFSKYFQKVFENNTFRVFKVLPPAKAKRKA